MKKVTCLGFPNFLVLFFRPFYAYNKEDARGERGRKRKVWLISLCSIAASQKALSNLA